MSAAQTYDLEFLPLGEERYDLILTKEFFNSWQGQTLLDIVKSSPFKEKTESLGGYSTRHSGEILWDGDGL